MNVQYFESFTGLIALLVSWPVIILLIIFLFRDKFTVLIETLTNKVDSSALKKAAIAGTSVEFYEPKTIETVIGKTNISAVPNHFDTDSFVFRSARFGFEISYPLVGNWNAVFDEKDFDASQRALQSNLSQTGQILAASIATEEAIDGFLPNINVLVQPAGDVSISGYVAESVKQVGLARGKVLSCKVDKSTDGATFTYLAPIQVSEEEVLMVNCVSRVLLVDGLAYLATLTVREGMKLPEYIRKDLSAMLNSFETTAKREE